MTDTVANDQLHATGCQPAAGFRSDRGLRRHGPPVHRALGTVVGWVALPVHPNELDSLLEALQRGADLMGQGPRRAAACCVVDRLTILRRELSQRAVTKAGAE